MSWRGASSYRATRSASAPSWATPRMPPICGQSGSTATRAICSRLQNDITRRIAVALNRELVVAEAARPTEHPDAIEYILRGRAALMKLPTRDSRMETIQLFERALQLEPKSVNGAELVGACAREPTD